MPGQMITNLGAIVVLKHRADVILAKDSGGLSLKDDGGNLGLTILDGGEVLVNNRLHARYGSDTGITPHASSVLVVEYTYGPVISIICPSTRVGYIFFGDEDNNNVGQIYYNHSLDEMVFKVFAANRMVLDKTGLVSIPGALSVTGNVSIGADSLFQVTGGDPFIQLGTDYDGYIYLAMNDESNIIYMDGTGYCYIGGGGCGAIEFSYTEYGYLEDGDGKNILTWNPTCLILRNGPVFINESSNAKQVIGLTINEGPNNLNEVIAVKGSTINHGMTGRTETDTYFYIRKRTNDKGGVLLEGLVETGDKVGMELVASVTDVEDTFGTGSDAAFRLTAYKKDGAGVTSLGTDGLIITMDGKWALNYNGDTWQLGSVFIGALSNANMGSNGLTIEAEAWYEVIALKVPDLDHQLTAWTETDTVFARSVGDYGSVYDYIILNETIDNWGEAYSLNVACKGADTTKTSSTTPMIKFYCSGHNGAGTRIDVTADGALFGVTCRSHGTRWLVDVNGTTWQDGSLILGSTELTEANLQDLLALI